jgi:hypothetical protein
MKKQLVFILLLSCLNWLGFQSEQFAFSSELNFEALQVVPDSDLGRWYSGQVYFDGQWRRIEQVQQLVATDPRWQEYQRLADTSDGSPEFHAKIAYWCQRNELAHEEKLHWLYVLQAIPNHRGAMKGLRLMRYRDQLYPIDQVTELKQQAKAAKRALRKYKSHFLILRRIAQSGSETEREAALAELAAVYDPAAIPALVEVAKLEFRSADSPPNIVVAEDERSFELTLQQMAVAALANISSHEATLKLLEIAVMSPYEKIRHLAAEALIPREKTSYMPLLMTSLAAPLEATIGINVSPSGMVMLSEEIAGLGPEAEQIAIRDTIYLTKTYNVRRNKLKIKRQLDWANMARARQTMNSVAATNYSRQLWNTRIHEVLLTTAGEYASDDPQEWWDYWKDYNEISYPDETPTHTTYTYDNYVSSRVNSASCFAAGTSVWTLNGSVPIESIQVGDLVLSQDPVTGCLDYRPVLQTTVRPPSPTIAVSVGEETIVATRGHRFWVVGEGWRMAKHLNAGDRLHGASFTSNLETAEEGSELEAFNLIVGEFHTYFVGNSKLLVHDNGCPSPTQTIAPGIEPASDAVR